MKTISDRQSTLFDLEAYAGSDTVMWGWLEPEAKLGSNNNLLPNSEIREQNHHNNLLPNSPVREQPKPRLPNLEIVKVQGRSYFLTPNKNRKLLPRESIWYDIKTQKGNQYLYIRWREQKKQKSRCLGRIDELKYSE